MSLLRLQRGIGKLTFLVFGTITFVALYCAYHILPFYYYYYELVNQFESHARVAQTFTDKELRYKLWNLIKYMNIPCNPEDLKIERNNGFINISLSYKEIFYLTYQGQDYDIHTFDFHARASAPIEEPKRL
ncbi:MAG: hypothetical protein J5J00_01725 [Deltaproteobacteria bacterium]|nr:hypothetical protein [Deltaproteobacteria bacterium]